jgi:hypothetical protein
VLSILERLDKITSMLSILERRNKNMLSILESLEKYCFPF